MERCAVFFDIDGTITDKKTGQIPKSVKPAIEKLMKNGHLAVINTGRPYRHILQEVLDLGMQGCICACGSYILCDNKLLLYKKPTDEICRQMRDLVKKCGMDAMYESMEGGFCDIHFSARGEFEVGELKDRGVIMRRDVEAEDFHFDKFVVWHRPESDFKTFIAEAEPHFNIIYRSEFFTELVPKGCTKATGIDTFLQLTGIEQKNTFAFGDSLNDMDMFRRVHTPILMGDGSPELKEHAAYVTEAATEDGIQKGLEHFGLI